MAARKRKPAGKKATSRKSTKASAKTKRSGAAKGRKAVVKKAVVKRSSQQALNPTISKISVGNKPFSKSEFISAIADRTGVPRKYVQLVMGAIAEVIEAHLQKQGPETFAWPGMFKIQVIKKPATKARKGINPFTGEEMIFKAKPASRKVKVRPLKQLKQMAA